MKQIRCTELDHQTHEVLKRISEIRKSRDGYAAITEMTLAEEFEMRRKDMTELVTDLEGFGFLEVDRSKTAIKVHRSCECLTRGLSDAPGVMVDTPEPGDYSRVRAGTGTGTGTHSSSQGEASNPTYGRDKNPPPTRRRANRAVKNSKRTDSASQRGSSGRSRKSNEDSENATSPRRIRGPRGVRKSPKPPENHRQLAEYFADSVREMKKKYNLGWIGVTNLGAVSGQIKRWMDEGLTAEQIREMIDLFCSSPRWTRRGVAPWRSFLYRAEALAARVSGPPPEAIDWLGSEALDRWQDEWGGGEVRSGPLNERPRRRRRRHGG